MYLGANFTYIFPQCHHRYALSGVLSIINKRISWQDSALRLLTWPRWWYDMKPVKMKETIHMATMMCYVSRNMAMKVSVSCHVLVLHDMFTLSTIYTMLSGKEKCLVNWSMSGSTTQSRYTTIHYSTIFYSMVTAAQTHRYQNLDNWGLFYYHGLFFSRMDK